MMYQRDMGFSDLRLFGEEAQQEADRGREEGVDPEEEEGEHHRQDDHHDRGRDRFLAARPVDLRGLGADLTDEFAGGSLGHLRPLQLAVTGVNPVKSILATRGSPAMRVSSHSSLRYRSLR